MLHSIAHLLTLFAMLLHSFFGCCWHHSHACGCETSATAAGSSELIPVCACPCGCDTSVSIQDDAESVPTSNALSALPCDPQFGDDSPCQPRHCEQDRCVYLNATATAPLALAIGGWFLPALDRDASKAGTEWGAFHDPDRSDPRLGGASLRAYLQIWRI